MTGFLSIIPITNLSSDVDLVELNEETRMRRISKKELDYFLKKCNKGDPFQYAMSHVDYVTEIMFETKEPSKIMDDITIAQEYSDAVILALRLLKAGNLANVGIFTFSSAQPLEKSAITINWYYPVRGFIGEHYYLRENESSAFTELWQKLCTKSNIEEYLRFGIDSFTKAVMNFVWEDRLVEFIVALESIAFYGEKKSIEPAGNVIGITIGMLLGNNQKERTSIKKTLIDAYDVRNARVHGNLTKLRKHKERFEELATKVEEYTRCTLRKFVEE
ncbi:HEPN domain-containing protein [Candidatus Bathyarchaeota archaeon]|nr:HEPN domain-containing protein [Candidatus Bathyarchaeota archaeon]